MTMPAPLKRTASATSRAVAIATICLPLEKPDVVLPPANFFFNEIPPRS
jgi:hypothetical protein